MADNDSRPELVLRRGRKPKGTFWSEAEELRGIRLACGLDQGRAAEMVLRDVTSYQDWESGRARVPRRVRERLLEMLTWKRTGVRPWWADPFGDGGE